MSDPEPVFSSPNSSESRYGELYLKWSRTVGNMFLSSPKKRERLQAKRKQIYEASEAKHNKATMDFREIEYKFSDTHQSYKKAERTLGSAEKAHEKAERIYRQEKLNSALDFLGWDISFHEIVAFSGFCAVLSLILGFVVVVPAFILLDMSLMDAGLFLIPGLLATPLVVYAFVASYPEILVKRVKTQSLGRSPEAVNYLVMSMRLSPSISKAVAFAANSADEPIASGLKKVLWNIYMHKYDNIEESFLAFAYEWAKAILSFRG